MKVDAMQSLLFLPEQASTFAERVDNLHYLVIISTMIVSFLVGTTALVFFILYRRRKPHAYTPTIEPDLKAEMLFVGIPTVFFLAFFAIGFRDFVWVRTPPANAMDVYVMGKQWMWKFAYPEGPNGVNTLHIPAHRPIRLLITSRDVIHSFYVPEFRVKQDAVPGRYAEIWFEATKPGTYQVLCAEYCGLDHSMMRADVVVHEPAEFDEWLANAQRSERHEQQDSEPIAAATQQFPGNLRLQGERIAARAGCFKCHSTDGSPHIGPTFLDMYLRKEKLADGRTVIADESYITESMMDPHLKVVAGFQPVMPSFLGQLDAPETAAIVEYIKSLSTNRVVNEGSKGPVYELRNR
ncbi:MAG: cytochrome c oxidase subunit II [Myxococcaceae bacterium]|nr:cytochrome c oxidase subunit II [Myxococcaceae bacterium]